MLASMAYLHYEIPSIGMYHWYLMHQILKCIHLHLCRYLDGSDCFDEVCCAIGESTLSMLSWQLHIYRTHE